MKNIVLSRLTIRLCAGVILVLASLPAKADVTMPGIFGDHMVLQQESKLPVWGWAASGEIVTVTLGGDTAKATAGTDGKWRVDLPSVPGNTPAQTLTVSGKNTLTFNDVLVGDVWICAGQSNMEYGGVDKVVDNPNLRIFWVTKYGALTPQDNIKEAAPERPLYGKWQVCTKEALAEDGSWGGFSAVGYYFAHDINQATNRPVGMIGAYWGGTPAQAWTSLSALEKKPTLAHYAQELKTLTPDQQAQFPADWVAFDVAARKWDADIGQAYTQNIMKPWQDAADKAKAAGQPSPPPPAPPPSPRPQNPGNVGTPTVLFNGMINPLIPYAIKGVIWYQGESNAYGAVEYETLFPAMISDWREKWGQGNFPFLFVQLPNWEVPGGDAVKEQWPLLRASQAKTLALPNTGMAVTIDIGEADNLHPRDKRDVGARLALVARHVAYGEDIVSTGPSFDSMKVEGSRVRVSYKNKGGGLVIGTPPNMTEPLPAQLTGFEVAGADKKWVAAKAQIDGETVVVSSDQVPAPVAVRYAWANNPVCDLYNREGLPAAPFQDSAF